MSAGPFGGLPSGTDAVPLMMPQQGRNGEFKMKMKTYGTKFRIDGDSRMYSTTRKFKGCTPGAALALANCETPAICNS